MKTQRKRLAAVLLSATLTLSNLAGILPQSNVLAAEESVQTEMAQAESASSEAQPAPAAAEAAQPAPAPAAEAAQPAPAPAAEPAQPAPAPAEEPAAAAPAESVSTPEPAAAETPAAPQQESAAPAESQSAESSAADTQQSASNSKLTEKEGQTAGKAETVTVYYAAAEGGSVSSASEVVQASSGQTVGSEAKAAEGFVFKNWTAPDGTVVSTSAFFAPQISSVTNGGSYTYTAHFEKAAEAPATRMVTVEYVAGNGGTVDRDSETVDVLSADAALLGSTATAQEGYQFVDWTASDDSIVSSNAFFVPALSADMPEKTVYTANFKKTDTMPAQDFEGSVSGVSVRVHADEGRFPEGTTMHLAPVSKASILNNDSVQDAVGEDKEVVDAIAVDITFQDKDGKEIEPAGTISVNMATSRDVSGDRHQVLHIDDSGNASQVTDASADGASFEAGEFSIYVITGIGTTAQDPAVETWNFYGADNSTILSTQSVKNEETIVSPKTPEKDGYIFQGWAYSVERAKSGAVDVTAFTIRTADVSTTQTINLYPVFSQKLYVFFMDNYKRVWETKEGKKGDKISTSDVTLPLGSEESVTGWYTDSSLTGEAVAEVTLENSDVTLYPKVESGHYLFFSSGDGASYVAPQFVSANAATAKPADPTRSGYTFKGWASVPDSAKADYIFGGKLNQNTTVYAVWEANTNTNYTVIYWKQSVNDKKDAKGSEKTYDYEESDTRTGTSGQTASPVYLDQNQNYTGFHYNSSKSVPVTINGDGTTILNVYYDRNTLTIDFYKPSGLFGSKWSLDKTFTGLYGQTLAQNGYTWPSEYNWYNSRGRNHLTFLDAFIFDTLDEYGDTTKISLYRDNSSGDITINHYKQNLDGSYSSTPTNSTKTNGGTFYFSNKYNGFTLDTYSTNGYQWKSASVGDSTPYRSNLYIRYTRNDYTLSFYNYNEVSRKEQVLYEALLSSYANYVPDRPSELSEDFQFEGWYKEPELTQKFDFSQTMPAGGITLYAKWAEPTYNGTVHLTIDGTGETTGLTIGYGATISEADMPTVVDADGNTVFQGKDENTVKLPKDVDWIGWATKNGTQYTAFQFATQIFDDITLYPYYVSKTKYTVTYDVNGGSGTVTDGKEYASGSYADIQSGDSVTAPEGKAFLYWNTDKEGKGVSYYPGDKLLVNDKATLYAVYGDPAQTTSLTYRSNYPAGSGQTDTEKLQSVNGSETLQNNASFKALTVADAGFTVPDGYYFKGWNTAANGSGTSVAAGADILVDADGTNKLYAQWEKKKAVVLTVTGKNVIVPYDGKEHSVKGYTTAIKVDGATATVLPGNLQLDESKAIGKTATGTDADTYYIGLVQGDFSITGTDLEKYSVTIQVTDGGLTIQPRTVTLKSASATMAYDGTTLTAQDVTIGSLGFIKGEVTSVAAKGTQTAVGTSDNKPIEIVKGTNYKDSNYDIKYEYGTLTVTKSSAAFTIKANNAEKTYDGTALTESRYTVTKPQGFEKFEVTAVVSGTITDAGTADNTVDSYTIKDLSGTDVTGNFTNVIKENGTLKVNPRQVTLTSATDSKIYDGTPLTNDKVTVTGDGFVDGEIEEGSIKATGSQLEKGTSENPIAYNTVKDKFKEKNYEIEEIIGTLTVYPKGTELVVTAPSGSWKYDGTVHSTENKVTATWPSGDDAAKYTVTATVSGSVKDVRDGTVANVIDKDSIKITEKSTGKDVTSNFDMGKITTKNGTLQVTPRKVVLLSASGSKPYDGTALELPIVTVTGDGFVDGEIADGSIKATGTITEVGSVTNSITYSPAPFGGFDENNYEIRKEEGTLSISKAEIAFLITANSHTWPYDGKAHSDSGYTVTVPENYQETYGAFKVEAVVEGSVTNVTEKQVANKITSVTVKKQNGLLWEDVTGQFDTDDMILEDGELQISPVNLTLTSESYTKEYDGTPLERPNVKTEGSIITTNGKAQISNIRATGSVIGVTTDPVPNTITYETSEDFIPENYIISKEEGLLAVTKNTKAEIILTAKNASKTYDGTPLTEPGVDVTGLPDGFTAQAEAGGSITNVSQTVEGNNPVSSYKILDKEGKDVKDWFTNVTTKAGTLTITAREITLTSADATKPYDGSPLEKEEVTVSGTVGLADTHIIEYTFTGSQTYVGSSPNTFTYLIKDKEGNEIPVSEVMPAPKKSLRAASQDSVKKGNYIITVVYGTLTVTDDVKPEQVVSKTHEGKAYQLGEQIVFEIRVTNIYDTAQTITLIEQDGVVFTGPYTFTNVEPGQTVTTSAFHVVNEDDLKNGTYTNTVKADFKEVKKTWEGTDDENQFAHLTLEKEVTNAPADGTAYMNGETIRYRITLTNDGTTALYNLNVADILTGDKWNGIEKLAPGGQLTFDTSYKVTDPDAENGFVTNQAVGNAQDANGNFVEPQPASVRVAVQKAKPSLYLEKTSDKDKAVDLGETIHYTIHLVNNGNTTVSDIVVTDEMTGDSWNAGTLKPGEDKTFHTEYVVTEKDILAGSVKNVALADGKDPNGDKTDVTPGEKENKTVPENAHLTVTKKTVSSPKNHSGYAVGETIRYQIEAFNDGNLTLTDVEVTDPLTGETWKVEKLVPGEKQTFETKYTVTEKDQSAGKVVNKATGKGKTPGTTKLIVVPGRTSDPVLPKSNEVVTTSTAVPTGDPTQTGAYLAMLLVAAAGIMILSRKKKEERRK
ncbi:DUF7507 domain-containing protein [Porcincola intestinalis]|uniref:InlB B-repeat-containing protein n=1 Tax=Porcincola intestinalis TaxID=2606632 RepID=A0A6L5X449_9FIRM|nr:InlB B-repeat-containing protein [Porcincola intestinalis]MSS14163.1 InlB B-repeat-containing protein [Porcincola intestinalis]